MTKGYFVIHRELFEKTIWVNSTAAQKVILLYLIGQANHDEKEWEWKGEKYNIKRGQLITSIDKIASGCGKDVKHQNVRTAIKRFQKLDFLTNESTKQGRLITILNYDEYQNLKNTPNKEANKDPTKTQQRANKELTPNNTLKELNTLNTHNTVEEKEDVFFEQLWVRYGRIGNKQKAKACWNKLSSAEKEAVNNSLDVYFEYLRVSGISKKHLTTYINPKSKEWTNDYIAMKEEYVKNNGSKKIENQIELF